MNKQVECYGPVEPRPPGPVSQSVQALRPGSLVKWSNRFEDSFLDQHAEARELGRLEPFPPPLPAPARREAATSATYNQYGFPATETDARGRTTTYTYDKQGDVTSITQFDDNSGNDETETITYGVNQVPTSITDFNGNTSTFTLDSDGNILTVTDAEETTTYTYNSAGQVLTDTDPNDNTTT